MRSCTRTFRVIAASTLAAAAFAAPAPAQHCPLAVLSGLRSQGTSYVVVTPAADTARAPAARGGDRALHGQVVRLDSSIGEQRAAGTRAVLVPWGRNDSCRRVPWASSARWLRPGRPALVAAKLRPRARWVHGMPTYDVDAAEQQPYPEKGEVGWEEPLLSVTEFADFLASVPTEEADSLDPEAARRPLWTWARRHRALAAKDPASTILTELCDDLIRRRLAAGPRWPMAGTYRVRAELTGEPVREMFVRTSPRPWSVAHPASGSRRENYCAGSTAVMYAWHVLGATTARGLEAESSRRSSQMLIGAAADSSAQGTVRWAVEFDPALLEAVFAGVPAYHQFRVATSEHYVAHGSRAATTPGSFVVRAGGEITFEQTLRLPRGRTLRLTGSRISAAVVE